MIKLTRLDHRMVAINPDHIAWVEANPDTTLCLLGDRKIIVLETLDEVCERFMACRAKLGESAPIALPPTPMAHRRPASPSAKPSGSGRPAGSFTRPSIPPMPGTPAIIDDDPPTSAGYRSQAPRSNGGA
jgi:flagellar protein FlbD